MADEPQSDALTDALGQRILAALADMWAHTDRTHLAPSTLLTLELLEELAQR